MTTSPLTHLTAGQLVIVGGDRVATVSSELAEAFTAGDRLVVVHATGDLLHVPADIARSVAATVERARGAFLALAAVSDEQISTFFAEFAGFLESDRGFAPIAEANGADVESARARGRSTTRLALGDRMRADMIAGLRGWIDQPAGRDAVVASHPHDGWRVDVRRAPLGVIGFVFEGRPNVFADAAGVVRSGNTAVFRIGSDALRTATAIARHALDPALAAAGLPVGTIGLIDSPTHAAGWALFDDPGLSLAVARGSGRAVAQLGAVARQAGTPVSLHGTGGAWLVAGRAAPADRFRSVVRWSLDRKVCNTLNVACIPRVRAGELVPVLLDALSEAAAARGNDGRIHVVAGGERYLPPGWFDRLVAVTRAEGRVDEPRATVLELDRLGHEWEWEDTPEVTLCVVDDVDEAVSLFNRYSPRLVGCLVSTDEAEQEQFWTTIDAPFVGDGFTRWVDGQFALGRPELGLSNWENGRLFGRSGVLSGDGVHTLRLRAVQADPDLHR